MLCSQITINKITEDGNTTETRDACYVMLTTSMYPEIDCIIKAHEKIIRFASIRSMLWSLCANYKKFLLTSYASRTNRSITFD